MPKTNPFKVGDTIVVVRGDSLNWVADHVPLRVIEVPWRGFPYLIQVNHLDGSDPSKASFNNHVRWEDCEHHFLWLCQEAIQNAKSKV